ncbi:MAG TPA: serine/threonine-protein kinase [Gemmatimonadales bacterium]|nr:serine/threonine-protein kinase [Gemmatimonadales bacterium]
MTVDITELERRLQSALGAQYRLEGELGQGGMGVVFLARDVTLDRPVAVKVIRPELAIHSSITQRFLAEARLVARLRHPNIVTVHTAGETAGLFYYVMDLVPGESLRQRLARVGKLPADEVTRIVADLADALAAAGRQGVVHRDMKPENVLLDRDTGRALLTDFGIARAMVAEGSNVITGQGMAVGTPTYMSPEQAAGEDVDHRSDIYALGIVAYEMLAGYPPFRGASNAAVVAMQIAEAPVPIQKLRPDTPPALAGAVMKALAKDPAARWSDGLTFRRAVLGEVPLAARGRRWLPAAVAAALLAGAGLLFALRRGGPPRGVDPRHSILVLPFDNLRRDSTLEWLRQGSVSMLALDLAQWNDLTVVDQERVHDLYAKHQLAPDDPIGLDMARQLARDAGAWTLVLGDYERTGDSMQVTARMLDVASGKRVDLAQAAVAADSDVRPAFDQLAARLLDVSGAPGGLKPGLAGATTSSLEAYRAYLTGIDELNHWNLESADTALRRAIALDSTFGLAYYKLALTRGWIGGANDQDGRRALVYASRYAGRLPARQQSLISAYQSFLDGDLPHARELYAKLVARDSIDTDAWYALGDAWFHDPDSTAAGRAKKMTNSLRAFRRALALDPAYALAYEHVAMMYTDAARDRPFFALVTNDSFAPGATLDSAVRSQAIERARRAGIQLSRDWVAAQPGTERAHRALIDAYAAAHDVPDALQEIDRLRLPPGETDAVTATLLEGRARFAAGDISGAIATLRPAYDSLDDDPARIAQMSATDYQMLLATVNPFLYAGDLGTATRVIALTRGARQRMPPEGRDTSVDWRYYDWVQEGQYYGPAGSSTELRKAWRTVAEAARNAKPQGRAAIARAGAAAALGLLLSPEGDTIPVTELRALTGDPLPGDVAALVAIARGDTSAARQSLATTAPAPMGTYRWGLGGWVGTPRLLTAYAHFQLGDYSRTLDLLSDYTPEDLQPNALDPRWAALGWARLVRGLADERLGRKIDAEREYRSVLAQWKDADPKQVPLVLQARAGLGRVTGTG